jgi:hypothetical protein
MGPLGAGAALALLCVPSATLAQGAAPGACELHFWPNGKAQTSYESGVGGVAGALLTGPGTHISGSDLAQTLSAEAQVRSLESANLTGTAARPTVILESAADAAKLAKRNKTRLSTSSAPCYAELLVKVIGYRSHITAGRQFGVVFIYREFGPEGPATRTVEGYGGTIAMRVFPARDESEAEAATKEVLDAYRTSAETFFRKEVHRSRAKGS